MTRIEQNGCKKNEERDRVARGQLEGDEELDEVEVIGGMTTEEPRALMKRRTKAGTRRRRRRCWYFVLRNCEEPENEEIGVTSFSNRGSGLARNYLCRHSGSN